MFGCGYGGGGLLFVLSHESTGGQRNGEVSCICTRLLIFSFENNICEINPEALSSADPVAVLPPSLKSSSR